MYRICRQERTGHFRLLRTILSKAGECGAPREQKNCHDDRGDDQSLRRLSGAVGADRKRRGSQAGTRAVPYIECDNEHAFAFLDPPQQPDELGRLGNYRVFGRWARAMGTVFEAEDQTLLRPVALKVMNTRLATDSESRQRFLRKAQATAALEHDHIVHIYEVGQHHGLPFLAMQRLRGETLAARLSRPPRLPLAEVLRIGREIATGLQPRTSVAWCIATSSPRISGWKRGTAASRFSISAWSATRPTTRG